MRILFCSEGFIVDGVASYNLYLADALLRSGHQVAIAGRWGGLLGFQKRHRLSGATVIQRLAIAVDSRMLVKRGSEFEPDILITDARRAFPLACNIRHRTGAKTITVFHDPPQLDRKGNRSPKALSDGSDAWVSPERPIYDTLLDLGPDLPVHWIQRPITGMIQPEPLPSKDPFKILCLGRLSRWKSPGLRHIVENAWELKRSIPSLHIDVVGGGRRRWGFWASAQKANIRAGKRFVRILGTQTDPRPWIRNATVVCAGATAAAEAILNCRPVLAFSGFWFGPVTQDNMDRGVSTHFGERAGEFYVRDDPDVVLRGILSIYEGWNQEKMQQQVRELSRRLSPVFDYRMVSEAFQRIFDDLQRRS